jgi:DNA-binding NarL/FixJ family response regulator
MIRILIADDHALVVTVLTEVLGKEENFEIIGGAETGDKIHDILRHREVDLILLDLSMPGVEDVKFITSIQEKYPAVKIIVLTSTDNFNTATKAIELGAAAYLSKDTPHKKLIEVINDVFEKGQTIIGVSDPKKKKNTAPVEVTNKEKDVIYWLIEGLTTKNIATKLSVAEATIEARKRSIRSKLDIQSDAGIGFWAAKNNILENYNPTGKDE